MWNWRYTVCVQRKCFVCRFIPSLCCFQLSRCTQELLEHDNRVDREDSECRIKYYGVIYLSGLYITYERRPPISETKICIFPTILQIFSYGLDWSVANYCCSYVVLKTTGAEQKSHLTYPYCQFWRLKSLTKHAY